MGKIEASYRPIKRRTFLKTGTAGLLSVVVYGEFSTLVSFAGETKVLLSRGVILADPTRCSGCRTCEAICCTHNTGDGRNSSELSRIIIEKDYLTGAYEQKVCFQCSEPLCLEACPTEPKALQVDKKFGTYARDIDPDLCIGCEQCIDACGEVFNPPRPRFDGENDVAIKCHLCHSNPQCVKFCPYGALHYQISVVGLKTGYPFIEGN